MLERISVFQTPERLNGEQAFQAIKENTLPKAPKRFNHGLSGDYFWILVSLENYPDLSQAKYLEIQNTHIDTAICYVIRDDKLTYLGQAGDKIPFHQRDVFVPNLVFELPPLNEQDELLILTDKQNGNNSFPMTFLSKQQLTFKEIRNTFLHSLFFGALILTFIIAFVSSIIHKSKVFLFYSLYMLFMSFFQIVHSGYGFALLYPNNPEITTFIRMFFVFFLMLSMLVFEYHFLQIKETRYIRYIHLFITSILLCTMLAGSIFYSFLKNNHAITFVKYYFTLAIILNTWSILAAFLLRKKVKTRAYTFLLGHFGNILGYVLTILKDTKIISVSRWMVDSLLAGTLFELLVFNIVIVVIGKQILKEKDVLTRNLKKTHHSITKVKAQNKLLESQIQFTSNEKPAEANPETNNTLDSNVIDYSRIVYIQVQEHYLHLFMDPLDTKNKIILREPLKSFFPRLPKKQFFQTHRSYVVNRHFIKLIGSTQVTLSEGTQIPISRTYKSKFESILLGDGAGPNPASE